MTAGGGAVSERAAARGIEHVLHYTSQHGAMGAIRLWRLLSRERVADEEAVAYIFEGIWPVKEPEWADHISLSLTRPNTDLFARSRKRFPDIWWAILDMRPEILDHEGVVFTTTNNIYSNCRRGSGVDGFEQMFEAEVPWGHYGYVAKRRPEHADDLPTHEAAEALYPGEISLDMLQRIVVPGEPHRRMIAAWCDVFDRPQIEVDVDPALLGSI